MIWDARNAPMCWIRRVTYVALGLSALALVPGTASFASSTPGPGTARKAGTKQVPGGNARILCAGRRSGTFSGTQPANPRLKRSAVTVSGTFSC
jgi:hypothetical protein